MKQWKNIAITSYLTIMAGISYAQEQRFPKPEFETGYVQPSPATPEPRLLSWEYFDILVLILVLSLAS